MELTWDQVGAITSKKFLPKAVDNIFDSNPFFQRMKERNTMKLDGGSTIMQPLEYSQNTANGWYSGTETLDTSDTQILTAAEYDWKQFYVNLTIIRLEELKNSGNSAKLKLAQAKMKNAEKTMADQLGVALYNAGSDAKALAGLRFVVNTTSSVGGISQTTNSWWQSQVDSTSTTLTMALMQSIYNDCSIGNDTPTVLLSNRSIYNFYYALLQPQQRFQSTDVAKGGFTSLMFNSTPHIVDSNAPANHLFFINEKYMQMTAHKDEFMRFEPWVKPTNQNLKVAKLYFAGNLTPSNNRMQGKLSAITN